CKSCVKPGGHEKKEYYLVDILKNTRDEMEIEKLSNSSSCSTNETPFSQMSVLQKFKVIDAVLDADIRPMLIMDGGNMEIIDIKEDNEYIDIFIRYLGACHGCASGATGTLYAIESVLQEKISPNIRVLPV
ncbi:MAG: NifU family protein, partial [Campylobacteraceae bacterium]|nr:NifU family protein [Campylobacteraceae bacterium]